jgi:hypothetical protein
VSLSATSPTPRRRATSPRAVFQSTMTPAKVCGFLLLHPHASAALWIAGFQSGGQPSIPRYQLPCFTSQPRRSMLTMITEFANKKVVLFSVPGAFTPSCSAKHLPGYIENLPKLKSKGVDIVACIAYNDAFVMSAWGKANGIKDEIVRSLAFPSLGRQISESRWLTWSRIALPLRRWNRVLEEVGLDIGRAYGKICVGD